MPKPETVSPLQQPMPAHPVLPSWTRVVSPRVDPSQGGDQLTGLGAPWDATTCNAAALPSRIPPADQRCPRCQGSLNIKSRTCTYCAFFPLTGCQGLGLASGPGIRKKRGEVSKETVPWEDE